MLTISDFSVMSQLSPQTLRFYHSEGLLVPAYVNERTGYRSYSFGQVEQAMLITALRAAGMSVKLVRRAVDEPGTAPGLLQQHIADLERQREVQDAAISDARAFLTSWPETRERHVPETTVVSRLLPGVSEKDEQYDWAADDAVFTSAAVDLIRIVESCGAAVSGAPWRTWVTRPFDQRAQSQSSGGPVWLLQVPITASEEAVAALPGDVEVQTFEARDEVSICLPGGSAMAKFGAALSRLLAHPLDGGVIDMSRIRQIVRADGVETAVAIDTPDDLEERFPHFTARTRTVLTLAIDQARAQSCHSVGTRHLLAGIIGEGANLALRMLQAIEIDPAQLQRDLAQSGGTEAGRSDQATSPRFSTAATRAFELAVTEAASLGSQYVGCEHLLLGLVGETDGTAGQVLRASGADAGATRRALSSVLTGYLR